MDKDQILEMHGDMLNWATEIIKASIPSLRRSYKCCYDNWAPEGVASRFKDDRNSEELSNYTVWNEALQFLEVMNNGEPLLKRGFYERSVVALEKLVSQNEEIIKRLEVIANG